MFLKDRGKKTIWYKEIVKWRKVYSNHLNPKKSEDSTRKLSSAHKSCIYSLIFLWYFHEKLLFMSCCFLLAQVQGVSFCFSLTQRQKHTIYLAKVTLAENTVTGKESAVLCTGRHTHTQTEKKDFNPYIQLSEKHHKTDILNYGLQSYSPQ